MDKAVVQNLDFYCDINESQYEAVAAAGRGELVELAENSKRHLADLIGADLQLTPHGQDVCNRALKVVGGWSEPAAFALKELRALGKISGISLAHRARKITGQFFNSADMKLMLSLAKFPGQAVRHLRRTYGNLDSMMERGIVTQGEFRGDPIYLTQSSMDLLHKLAGEVG